MTQFFNNLCIKIYLYFWLHNTKSKVDIASPVLSYYDFVALESCRYVINDSYIAFIDSATAANRTLELFLEPPETDEEFDKMFDEYLKSSRAKLKVELERKYSITNISSDILNEFIVNDIVKRIVLKVSSKSGTSKDSQLKLIEMKISDVLEQKARFDYGVLKMYLIDIKNYPLSEQYIPDSSKQQYEQMKGFFKNV